MIRAISFATNTNYMDTLNLVNTNGYKHLCDNLNVDCYRKLLKEHFNLKELDGNNKKVLEIARDNPDKTLIIRIRGHLTCAKSGTIYDIWDCTNEIVDVYWIVEE